MIYFEHVTDGYPISMERLTNGIFYILENQ